MPIYWGNPYVTDEFNPEAFINCNDFDSFDDVVKRVKEIDEDDDLWAHIVSQPWQTEEQKRASEKRYEQYKNFMTNIFTQPLEKAKRAPEGTWPDLWRRNFIECGDSILSRKFFKYAKNPSALFDKVLLQKIKRKLFTPMRSTDINDFFRD